MSRPNVNYIDADSLCDEAERLGLEWAEAKAAFEAVDGTRKSVLSQWTRSFIEEGMAFNKAETMALSMSEYVEFVESIAAAGLKSDRARVKYDIARTRIELLRTNASTERAAMSMR